MINYLMLCSNVKAKIESIINNCDCNVGYKKRLYDVFLGKYVNYKNSCTDAKYLKSIFDILLDWVKEACKWQVIRRLVSDKAAYDNEYKSKVSKYRHKIYNLMNACSNQATKPIYKKPSKSNIPSMPGINKKEAGRSEEFVFERKKVSNKEIKKENITMIKYGAVALGALILFLIWRS